MNDMTFVQPLIDTLSPMRPYLPHVLSAMFVVALASVAVVALLVRRARQRTRSEAMASTEPHSEPAVFGETRPPMPLLPLKKSFRHALKLLRTHVDGNDFLYAIPWYLLLGPKGAGKSTLLVG